MADVMSHGGDGARDRPHQPPTGSIRLASPVHSILCYPSYTEVLEEHRARLCSIIESHFDLQDDQSPDEYWAVRAVVDRLAADRYRDYKLKRIHGIVPEDDEDENENDGGDLEDL
ncbi:hypothetical protein Adt_45330 [Abeliophyllum distichum]|uniref:Uncharacterized protein n=1 Tax=Abeliophyllum distichum TaxID=126358 RepID=A0ABD1PDD7_9LAMI